MININKLNEKCKLMYVKLKNSMLYTVKNSNRWLYILENKQLVVRCDTPEQYPKYKEQVY